MILITFQHSIKYIYLKLVPYAVITIVIGFLAYRGLNILWLMAYLASGALLAWRMIALTAEQYFFTHDMLVISKGVIFKSVECRALWQLKGTEVRCNGLMKWLHICHIHCGLEGPPADRVRLTGVDNRTMIQLLYQLKEGIATNTEMWRNHFQPANA